MRLGNLPKEWDNIRKRFAVGIGGAYELVPGDASSGVRIAVTSFGDVVGISIYDNVGPKKFSDGRFSIQFSTGLTDKNGKEIYEGDVVKSHAVPEHMDADTISFVYWNVRLAKFGLAEVEHYRLYDKSINGLPFDWGGWKEHEVIGNVFENPELLTKLTNDV